MSTTSVVRQTLNDKQLASNRKAIKMFLAKAIGQYGDGSIILLPKFEETPEGEWVPDSDGVRLGAVGANGKQVSFMRLGTLDLNDSGRITALYTSVFGEDSDDVEMKLTLLGAQVGQPVKRVKLCVHESLTPFSRINPSRDIKTTPDGTACVKYVVDSDGVITNAPIYRRVKAHFANNNGMFGADAVDTFISHDNRKELSDSAFAKWSAAQKANTQAIQNAGKSEEQELAELQAIPKAKRTAEQKARIQELA